MFREQVVDEGPVAQPSPLRLPPDGVKDLRIAHGYAVRLVA
jgi:hypothetical protein